MVTPEELASLRHNALKGGRVQPPSLAGGGGVAQPVPPVPSCSLASIFSDCFTGYTNASHDGWGHAFIIGPVGGPVTYDGDKMRMDTTGFAFAEQDVAVAPPPVATNITLQTSITFPPVVPADWSLEFRINRGTATGQLVDFFFDATGFLQTLVEISPATSLLFLGTFFPIPSATVIFHVAIDGAGTATVFANGVPVPLTPSPSVFGGPSPGDFLRIDLSGTTTFTDIDFVMIDGAATPPTTIYCCPASQGNGPAT